MSVGQGHREGKAARNSLWDAVNLETEKRLHHSALFHLLTVSEERSNRIISVPKCIQDARNHSGYFYLAESPAFLSPQP